MLTSSKNKHLRIIPEPEHDKTPLRNGPRSVSGRFALISMRPECPPTPASGPLKVVSSHVVRRTACASSESLSGAVPPSEKAGENVWGLLWCVAKEEGAVCKGCTHSTSCLGVHRTSAHTLANKISSAGAVRKKRGTIARLLLSFKPSNLILSNNNNRSYSYFIRKPDQRPIYGVYHTGGGRFRFY
jgi:hypothetical protein